jgi:hypothetical protein
MQDELKIIIPGGNELHFTCIKGEYGAVKLRLAKDTNLVNVLDFDNCANL